MKNKIFIMICAFSLVAGCGGGGGGPSAPSITPPVAGTGTVTATGPLTGVADGATFDIVVDTDLETPMYSVELKLTYTNSFITTPPTVDITSSIFDSIFSAKYISGDETNGVQIVLTRSDILQTATGPGNLCTITFTNIVGGSPRTVDISFVGSKVDYESVGERSLNISTVSVDLLG